MKINHLAIWTKDLERLQNFYEKYFQLQTGVRYHNPARQFTSYFLCFDDGSRIEIMHIPDLNELPDLQEPKHIGLAHLAISTGSKEKVDELTNRLRTDGYIVHGEPRTTGDGYYESVITDPDGNFIEITV